MLNLEKDKLEITKMLTVSTAHIREKTFELLSNADTCRKTGLSVYTKKSVDDDSTYGLFIYIDPEDKLKKMPVEVARLVVIAYGEDCTVLCLDSDGPVLDGVPVFDWNK